MHRISSAGFGSLKYRRSSMATTIASLIIGCLKSFNDFLVEVERIPVGEHSELGLSPASWEDERGRLRMWAANIGAHQTGQSSLDFRLRDSSHIHEQILKLLQDLLERLHDAREVLTGGHESADEDELADDLSDDEEPTTEIQELRESLATIINCLFQMSMLVRKPAQHDMLMDSRWSEVAMFEPFDYHHVQDKYPKADSAIVERLGLAMTRRRKYLKYRERHALKLKQGINDTVPEGDNKTIAGDTATSLSNTVATKVNESQSSFDDGGSESGLSQTSYASTLLDGGAITFPKLPDSGQGGLPFECPYCHLIITAKNSSSWARHVVQDLQPYICIVATCNTPDKLYSTRREWLHHMKMVHPVKLTPELEKERTAPRLVCLLCEDNFKTEPQHDRHVARHLQELALFVLPRSDDDSGIDGESNSADEDSSYQSDGPEGLFEARVLLGKFDFYSKLLHEHYVPRCERALKEGVIGNQDLFRNLLDDLDEVVSTLQDLDLEDHRDLEHERELSVRLAKDWLDAVNDAFTQTLHLSTKDAPTEFYGPATSASHDDNDEIQRQILEGPTRRAMALCKVCRHSFHTEDSPLNDLECPKCSSTMLHFNYSIRKTTYLDAAHKGGDLDDDPDLLILSHLGELYPVRFPAHSIAESLGIRQLREHAAGVIGCSDPHHVELLYEGRSLKDDRKSCRDEGLKHNSILTCVVLAELESWENAKVESKEASHSFPALSGESEEETKSPRALGVHPQRIITESSQANRIGNSPASLSSALSLSSESDTELTSLSVLPDPLLCMRNGCPAVFTGHDRTMERRQHMRETHEDLRRATYSRTKVESAETVATAIKTSKPVEELQAISDNFDKNIIPEVQYFLANPPESFKARLHELERLSGKILTQVTYKLDSIEKDDGKLRDKRKECVKRADFWLNQLAVNQLWISKADVSALKTAESAASDKLH